MAIGECLACGRRTEFGGFVLEVRNENESNVLQ